ncbi:hypothetical protein PIROE2DRAFT_11009 [Piromyces sp. E2]|nr:hypothetical protein PIROE2DRAFT_11009 [Piromyces sp. E2]|eukprot:OUM62635.1 hypothetical protein PIROE2DRAFT_11009 [Piromyces sp. E2]
MKFNKIFSLFILSLVAVISNAEKPYDRCIRKLGEKYLCTRRGIPNAERKYKFSQYPTLLSKICQKQSCLDGYNTNNSKSYREERQAKCKSKALNMFDNDVQENHKYC